MTVGIVGAGAMGSGIARLAAGSGRDVVLYDARDEAAQQAVAKIGASLTRQVEKNRTTQDAADALLARITVAPSLESFGPCDLVIEAVIEDPAVKQTVFGELEGIVGADCVLATNTSSLSIGSVFRTLATAERSIGLHFFNPAHVMKLVEIIPGPHTNDATRERARAFVEGIDRTGIEVTDTPGFLVNLAGRAYTTEALLIAQEGTATIDQIDRVMTQLGFPLGPFQLMDLTGIDVNYPVTQNVFEHNFADPMLRSSWVHRYMFETGQLGQKTGRGFYTYDNGKAVPPERAPEPAGAAPTQVVLAPGESDGVAEFCAAFGIAHTTTDDRTSPILVAPFGEDCTEVATRLGVDPTRVLAVDLAFDWRDRVTLMAPPGADPDTVYGLATQIRATTPVEVIRDGAGFVAQRIVAAVVNLGCEIAQRGIAAPKDIDQGVELGLRYPAGPLALAEKYGPTTIDRILDALHRILRDDRYRTSQWLRRRARSGQSVHQPDFER